MLYNRRSVYFSEELELIYDNMFSPGSPSPIERLEFYQLADIAETILLSPGECYAEAGNYCDRIGIIVRGEVSVSIEHDEEIMRELKKLEFLDSQEFVFQHHKYMVTMKAKTDTVIVCWDKAKLQTLHVSWPTIKSAFFSALAHDVSKNFSEVQKLYISRSHKTTRYIRKLHKLLEEHQIETNVDNDIRKYALSPLVSARFVHNSHHHDARHPLNMHTPKSSTKLKPSVKKRVSTGGGYTSEGGGFTGGGYTSEGGFAGGYTSEGGGFTTEGEELLPKHGTGSINTTG